jgi:hypothetical protein
MEELNNIPSPGTLNQFSQTLKPNIYKYLFFLSTFVVIILGIFYFLSLDKDSKTSITNQKDLSSQIQKEKSDSTVSWSKPKSTDQVIPIVKENILYLYSLTNKKLQPTQYKTQNGGGSWGFGQENPLPSPDGKLIVFINKEDNNCLYLLTAGSQQALKITNYPVRYLNSWSSDSSKILFYTDTNNLVTRKDVQNEMGGGPYPTWETSETFIKGFAPGFHSFDISNGLDIYLYPISSAEKYIDQNRILVDVNQYGDEKKKRFVLFNVDTFTADFSTVNYEIKDFALQNSFTNDGNFWAINTDDGNPENGSKIIFAKFPSKQGDIVDSGSWAQVQRPLLNSNGKYLAYTKKGELIREGVYTDKTIIWDSSTQKVIKELDGFPQYWVNNTILTRVVELENSSNNVSHYNLFNVETQEINNFLVN